MGLLGPGSQIQGIPGIPMPNGVHAGAAAMAIASHFVKILGYFKFARFADMMGCFGMTAELGKLSTTKKQKI